jgi:hypothetical protein
MELLSSRKHRRASGGAPASSSGAAADSAGSTTASSMAHDRQRVTQQSHSAGRASDIPILDRLEADVQGDLESQGVEGGSLRETGPDSSMGQAGPGATGGLTGGRLSGADRARRHKHGKDSMKRGAVRGRHADTFQGGVVNRRTGGDARDFGGNGKGNAASGAPFVPGGGGGTVTATDGQGHSASIKNDVSKADADKSGGLATEGESRYAAQQRMAEEGYRQSVGEDGYRATASMSQSERGSYWGVQRLKQQVGGRENPDAMPTGPSVPMGRADLVNAKRGVAGRRGASGGAGDVRVERSGGGGGPMQRRAGDGKDRIVTEEAGGALNLDAVFALNPLVNPGAQ